VALVWSLVICVILMKSKPSDVGYGFAGTIVVGIMISLVFIRARRRGRIADIRSRDEIIEHETTA
jgi:hypothetical protein